MDRYLGSPSTLPSRSPVLPPRLCCQPLYRTRGPTVEDILGGGKSWVLHPRRKEKKEGSIIPQVATGNIHTKTRFVCVCMYVVRNVRRK